jgi:hypothetical protein
MSPLQDQHILLVLVIIWVGLGLMIYGNSLRKQGWRGWVWYHSWGFVLVLIMCARVILEVFR